MVDEVEANSGSEDTLVLSLRGVPLVDATGVEVLREIWERQKKGGGDVLLAAVTPRVERLLDRMEFVEEIGRERIFWSADRAILSLGALLPNEAPVQTEGETTLDSGQEVLPHERRTI